MNRLAILDDNLEFSRNLMNYIITKNKRIRLSSLAITGKEIMEDVNSLGTGDILLLDLGLPDINGLQVIEKLKQQKQNMPYIIVMSGNIELLEQLEKYKDYIYTAIEKPFAFQRVFDIIEQITYETEQKCYEQIVKEELRKFEINVTTIGYAYIVDAICACLEDETLLKDMQNSLYKSVSIKNNNINTNNIKWSIEKCIKSTKRYTSTSVTKSYFRIEAREKLTPKLFITTIVENLKEKIENELEEEEAYA